MFAPSPFYTPAAAPRATIIDLSKLTTAELDKLASDVQNEIVVRQREALREQETAKMQNEMKALKQELSQLRGEIAAQSVPPQQQQQQQQQHVSNTWRASTTTTRTSLPPLVPTKKPKAKAKPASPPPPSSTQYCKLKTNADGHPYWQICPDDKCGCQHYPTDKDDPAQDCPLLDTKSLHLSYLQQKGDKPDRDELEQRISEALGDEVRWTEGGLKFMSDLCSANIYFADHATASRAQELLMEKTNYGINFRRLPNSRK
jgi:hypothetical protein